MPSIKYIESNPLIFAEEIAFVVIIIVYCVARLNLGTGCQFHVQCGEGAQCIGSVCLCAAGYRQATDGINCLQGEVGLGANCVILLPNYYYACGRK